MKKGGGQISQSLGPDALRLWVASSDYTHDVVIGQPVLQHNHSVLLRYRIIIKMLLGSMHPSARTTPITKLDEIALVQLDSVMKEVANAYNNFEVYKGVHAISRWISTDLSAFYLEAMKDRLYCGDGGGVLEEIFQGLLRMLTPITPNLVSEAWNHRPKWMKEEDQIHPFHRTLGNEVHASKRISNPTQLLEDLPWLLSANAAIKVAQEEARVNKMMGSSLESSVVLEFSSEGQCNPHHIFGRYADELESIFIVSSVELDGKVEGTWKYSTTFDVPGGKATAWVLPPKDNKCPRCWRYVAPVEDELCKRCEEVVSVS